MRISRAQRYELMGAALSKPDGYAVRHCESGLGWSAAEGMSRCA